MTTRGAKLMTVITAVLVSAPVIAGSVSGSFVVGTGYLDNPLGIADDTPAGYLEQSLRLASTFGPAPSPNQTTNNLFKLGYEGNFSEFGGETSLGNQRHGLGLEWFRTSRVASGDPRLNSVSGGVQVSLRRYEDYYEIYDYSDVYSYLAFRRFSSRHGLWSGFAAARIRHYEELPEESYVEPRVQVKFQHFFDSRTTLGVATSFGVKFYNDSAASVIWDTPSLPSTSQMAARLDLAQGISDRFSLRGRVDSRWTLSDFPYYVADDIFDSPLLDQYAHEGWDVLAAAKWLGPMQIWAELVSSRGVHDYGSMLFATAPGGETRDDTVYDYYLTLDKSLTGKPTGPRLKLAVGWRDQASSITAYDYDGIFASSRILWQF